MKRRVAKPESRRVALVCVDVINGFSFPGSEGLVRAAQRAAPNIRRLAERARQRGVPVIYVNDNFGQWRSDFRATLRACTEPDQPGREVANLLRPKTGDYFVLKPQHSGFYCTTLELLLDHLQVHTLILVGFAADICVLFTANDAHMRGYQIVVPADCTAANFERRKRAALDHVAATLHGDVRPSTALRFSALERRARKPRGQTF